MPNSAVFLSPFSPNEPVKENGLAVADRDDVGAALPVPCTESSLLSAGFADPNALVTAGGGAENTGDEPKETLGDFSESFSFFFSSLDSD